MKKVISILGPTCSGKTDLAIALADKRPCHIISVDSALIYKHMSVGTAKPDLDLLAQHPHALVDIIEPTESYSVAAFLDAVQKEITLATRLNKTPILVGGTMMYFNALYHGLNDLPSTDEAVRERFYALYSKEGVEGLYAKLLQVDPLTAKRLKPNDRQRIQRALEVHAMTGEPLSRLQEGTRREPIIQESQDILLIPSDRAFLHQKIAARFDSMLNAGFLDEVRGLMKDFSLTLENSSMRSVGYRQAYQYLLGAYDYDTMRDKAIIATRQLAKRQLTWLRRWQRGICFDVSRPDLALNDIVTACSMSSDA